MEEDRGGEEEKGNRLEKEELVVSVKANKREGLERRIFEVFPFECIVPCAFWAIDLEVTDSSCENNLLRFKIKLHTIDPM